MGIRVSTVALLATAFLGGSMSASADHHGGPTIFPVEIYTCTYLDGKDANDLARVTTKWNTWADSKNETSYSAYLLTPFYRSADIAFDVAWLGASANGAAMGATHGMWISEGQSLQADFEKVMSCPEHSNFATITVRSTGDYSGGPVFFSDCKLKEGRSNSEAITALEAWTTYQAGEGVEYSAWAFFPAFGIAAGADYDFKWVTGYPSYEAMGKGYDQYTMGGGYQKSAATLERVMECDSPRVYATQQIRAAAAPAEDS